MKRIIGLTAATVLAAMWPLPASAQATRTWVSGVGDDVNPCSRTAPCKTFAGTISKTAAGGEIDVLDPGGFGAVTITKSMTIDGSGGSTAGILVSGQNGVVVNDSGAATAQVTLRNLDFEGLGFTTAGSGIRGVWFISGATLNVQHCVIRNFRDATNGAGIAFNPSGAARLYVDDTILTGNGNTSIGGGIVVQPTGTGSASGVLTRVRAENNSNVGLFVNSTGLASGNGANITVTDSTFSGSTLGVNALTPVAGTVQATIMMTHSTSANNTAGGVVANGAAATIRLGGSTVTNNPTGIAGINGGKLSSFADNYVSGNTTSDGTATPPTLGKL
jgi:hypothetical protein